MQLEGAHAHTHIHTHTKKKQRVVNNKIKRGISVTCHRLLCQYKIAYSFAAADKAVSCSTPRVFS
jgi:hypothetical protein